MQMFSNRLISLRKEKGMTQTDLANVIHVKRSTVSGYETEGKEPNLETICALAKYFGVTTDYLLGLSSHRTHSESVFYNDTVNFQRHFDTLPAPLRPVVTKCLDSFYLLLNRDMQLARPERLNIYQRLFATMQSLRAEIRKSIEASGGAVADPVALSGLMSSQSQLKNEICAMFDELAQADMEIAFDVKKGENRNSDTGSSAGKAI